jgi:hypothetical protein
MGVVVCWIKHCCTTISLHIPAPWQRK